MFKNPSKVIGHVSALKNGMFVGQEYIMTKIDSKINLFNRLCPHRFYPMGDILLTHKEKIARHLGLQPVKNWRLFE